MFDIGWSELLVIGVVALIAIGPKELPAVLRTVGQWMGKIRRMASEFQGQFHEAMREAELADVKKQVDEMANAAKDITSFDPLAEARHDIETVTGDLSTLGQTPAETATTTPASEPPAAAAMTPAPTPEPEVATATAAPPPPDKPAERS